MRRETSTRFVICESVADQISEKTGRTCTSQSSGTKAPGVFIGAQAQTDVEVVPLRGDGSEGRWRWGTDKVEAHRLDAPEAV
jgi:hypothetical protein